MKKTRKILSMILCSAMLVTVAPQTAFAEGEETGEQTGLCEHHTEHTDECGYEEITGTPCQYIIVSDFL